MILLATVAFATSKAMACPPAFNGDIDGAVHYRLLPDTTAKSCHDADEVRAWADDMGLGTEVIPEAMQFSMNSPDERSLPWWSAPVSLVWHEGPAHPPSDSWQMVTNSEGCSLVAFFDAKRSTQTIEAVFEGISIARLVARPALLPNLSYPELAVGWYRLIDRTRNRHAWVVTEYTDNGGDGHLRYLGPSQGFLWWEARQTVDDDGFQTGRDPGVGFQLTSPEANRSVPRESVATSGFHLLAMDPSIGLLYSVDVGLGSGSSQLSPGSSARVAMLGERALHVVVSVRSPDGDRETTQVVDWKTIMEQKR